MTECVETVSGLPEGCWSGRGQPCCRHGTRWAWHIAWEEPLTYSVAGHQTYGIGGKSPKQMDAKYASKFSAESVSWRIYSHQEFSEKQGGNEQMNDLPQGLFIPILTYYDMQHIPFSAVFQNISKMPTQTALFRHLWFPKQAIDRQLNGFWYIAFCFKTK